MSVQETNLAAIANAIRQKEGTTEPIPAADFAPRILALPSSGMPENVRTITVTSSDPEMGTVSGGGVASDGMTVTVTAQGIYGNLFEEWQENQTAVSKEKEYTFPVMKDRELTALFVDFQMDWTELPQDTPIIFSGPIAYGNGKFVSMTYTIEYGNIQTYSCYSTDGITWEKAADGFPLGGCNSIAYGDGKFVAVYYNTSKGFAYSEDGIKWENSPSMLYNEWVSVAYGDGKFVAVCLFGYIAYSTDGITWIKTTSPDNTSWGSVTYGGGKFVAVPRNTGDNDSSNKAIYSSDGITWKTTTLPANDDWAVTYGNGKFVAVGYRGNAAYSADGIVWHETVLPVIDNSIGYFKGNAITFGNGKFVAVPDSDSKAIYSTDGITWRETALPASKEWDSIAYGSGKFVAISSDYGAYALG